MTAPLEVTWVILRMPPQTCWQEKWSKTAANGVIVLGPHKGRLVLHYESLQRGMIVNPCYRCPVLDFHANGLKCFQYFLKYACVGTKKVDILRRHRYNDFMFHETAHDNARKRRSTVDLLFTESCRTVRGAKSLTGIHLGAADPNAEWRRVGSDGWPRYRPRVLLDTCRAAGCEFCRKKGGNTGSDPVLS